MEETEKVETLSKEFLKHYSHKYKLLDKKPIGKGHFAFVLKCSDIERGNLEVAIKIFFKGTAPAGSIRGWHLTSKAIHNQIAPTYTIESFHSNYLNEDCKAVVQRFIPGEPLKKIFDWFNKIENDPNYQKVLNDFGLTFLNSLLGVLNFCHNQEFGHGDLHEGNIIVFMEDHPTNNSFRTVLIDFDNSSVKAELHSEGEKGKIKSDIGLFKRIFDNAFFQWRYYNPVSKLFQAYDTTTEFQFSYSIVSSFIKLVVQKKNMMDDIMQIFKMLPHPFMGFHIPPTIRCLKEIAEIENISTTFDDALASYVNQSSNPQNWTPQITIEYLDPDVNDLYKLFFK